MNSFQDSDYFKKLQARNNVILLGDSIGDLVTIQIIAFVFIFYYFIVFKVQNNVGRLKGHPDNHMLFLVVMAARAGMDFASLNTIEPGHNHHPWDLKIMAVIDRWSPFGGGH